MNRVAHFATLDLYNSNNIVPTTITLWKAEVGARKIAARLATGKDPYIAGSGVTAQLRAITPSGSHIYSTATLEGSMAYIDVTSQLVAAAGIVRCALSLVDGEGNLLFTPQFTINVQNCLFDDEGVESTDEYSALSASLAEVQTLKEKWANATATAQSGQAAAVEATVGDDNVSFAFTLPQGEKGPAGVSVTVGTTVTGDAGTNASVSNSGTASDPILNFTIPKGADGMDGQNGADGFSPVATVTQLDGGARITVTDASGTTTQDVMNGHDGVGIPDGGTAGQLLSKTATGTTWKDPAKGLFVTELSLPTTGYAAAEPHTIDITAAGVSTDANKVYDLIPDWSAAASTRQAEKTAWNLIDDYRISAANTLTLTVRSVPPTAVSFVLKEVI